MSDWHNLKNGEHPVRGAMCWAKLLDGGYPFVRPAYRTLGYRANMQDEWRVLLHDRQTPAFMTVPDGAEVVAWANMEYPDA